ncbi:hypothetical protein TFLX_01473 [Thermoflexales bacterium]|nr:hypothetical protein TFLX_01473 [Thermoflexales bacterium]
MFRSTTVQLVLVLVAFTLAACAPAQAGSNVNGPSPTLTAIAATKLPAPNVLRDMQVASVKVQIGVGSPIPVDAFISAELPDACAQLAEVKVTRQDFLFEIALRATPGMREECFRDTLPFRMYVPLNMVNLPEGTYTINVNGAITTFTWPSEPTITPEPIMTVPAEWETYRNEAIRFEVDYPQGWIVDKSGDTDILWSEKPGGPGNDGVPANVVKIDIVTEPNTTLTLEELLARQKQIIADSNGKVLLEEAITLPSGLPTVRMGVSGFGESIALLAVIEGHPLILVGYGDLARFDDVAHTLRAVQQ